MKLHQNQLWRQGDQLYRIVTLERLSVAYKKSKQGESESETESEAGTHHVVTKKEFCRLIKGAVEVPDQAAESK
ncbi:MAG: hypothetical protein L3J39_10295 [Verrucomicrobiales bacterium]|nr:hypothetical protein [Verrucomicrobiales bacterium]